jgi:hypothetical protein
LALTLAVFIFVVSRDLVIFTWSILLSLGGRWNKITQKSGIRKNFRSSGLTARQRIAKKTHSTEGTEKLHYRERHDQDAHGGHQPPGWNALNKPPPEWGRQHAAQYEWNQLFQWHGANFRKECSCS